MFAVRLKQYIRGDGKPGTASIQYVRPDVSADVFDVTMASTEVAVGEDCRTSSQCWALVICVPSVIVSLFLLCVLPEQAAHEDVLMSCVCYMNSAFCPQWPSLVQLNLQCSTIPCFVLFSSQHHRLQPFQMHFMQHSLSACAAVKEEI